MSRRKPEILAQQWLAHSRLFHVEQLDLRFSNGEERSYERLNPWHHGAVMIVPVLNGDTLLLVREYGGGIHDYYLSFPKGAMQAEEAVTDAANRELMEEVGVCARQLSVLGTLSLSPSYMGNRMTLVLAEDLFEKSLPGDEPEPLEVVHWPLENALALLALPEFTEAYAVAALFMARERLGAAR